jgi:DNA-binding Lrp family transcriptional regulator
VILNVEDPLVTLANPYDLIVVVPTKDYTQIDEEVRQIAAKKKSPMIKKYLIKKIREELVIEKAR